VRLPAGRPRERAGLRGPGAHAGGISVALTRNTDAGLTQPTRSTKADAGIVGVDANNTRTCGAGASELDPPPARSYFRGRPDSSARSIVRRETPTSRPISGIECWPVENSRSIFAQSSILSTLHVGRSAPFSRGDTSPIFGRLKQSHGSCEFLTEAQPLLTWRVCERMVHTFARSNM